MPCSHGMTRTRTQQNRSPDLGIYKRVKGRGHSVQGRIRTHSQESRSRACICMHTRPRQCSQVTGARGSKETQLRVASPVNPSQFVTGLTGVPITIGSRNLHARVVHTRYHMPVRVVTARRGACAADRLMIPGSRNGRGDIPIEVTKECKGEATLWRNESYAPTQTACNQPAIPISVHSVVVTSLC